MLKMIKPVVSASTTFSDLRRVIRAIRFKHQHKLTLSNEIIDFIANSAPYSFAYYKRKYEFIGDFVKVLSDKNFCVPIMVELAAKGLVLNCERVILDANKLTQAFTIVETDLQSSEKFDQLLSAIKSLPRALAVTLGLLHARSQSLTVSDVEGNKFYEIIRNMISKSRNYEGKSENFISDIQSVILTEIKKKNKRLIKVLECYGCPNPTFNYFDSSESGLSMLYKKLLKSDSESVSKNSWRTIVDSWGTIDNFFDDEAISFDFGKPSKPIKPQNLLFDNLNDAFK